MFNNIGFDEFANKISMDINVSGELSAYRIFAHSDTGQVVFKDVSGGRLRVSKIAECFAQIHYFLGCLAGCDKFSL